ncbi:FkbM family methyltransferase [Dankookia sp. GCM10030260]|uniref:FkbM family methyltransferase n=1 Tax=Dankookia sp. GCM10030260 TaxID=3273390 RepID=UPI003619D969
MLARLAQILRSLWWRHGFGARRTPPGGLVHLGQIRSDPRYVLECRVRSLTGAVYLGDSQALCRVLGRYKMFVDTRDRGLGSHLLLDGYWEIWLTRLIARAVRPGMACVDVGANLGYYALLMADLAGPRGRVLAIEPNPAVARLLQASLDVNGYGPRAEVMAVALGDGSDGTGFLAIPHNEPKNAALVAGAAAGHFAAHAAVVEVPVLAFDSLAEAWPRIDLVKIDAEGAEDAILRGMAAMLRRDRPLLILEFNHARPYDGAAVLAELLGIYGAVHRLDSAHGVLPSSIAAVLAATDGEDQLLVFGDAARLHGIGGP